MNKGLLGTDLKEMPGYLEPETIVYTEKSGKDQDETGEEWEIDCYSRPVMGDDGTCGPETYIIVLLLHLIVYSV